MEYRIDREALDEFIGRQVELVESASIPKLLADDHGVAGGQQVLHPGLLDASLQRDTADRGLTTSGTTPEVMSRTPLIAASARVSSGRTPKSRVAAVGTTRNRRPIAAMATQARMAKTMAAGRMGLPRVGSVAVV